MTTSSFNAEYQCEWPNDDNWAKLVELARRYHEECEAFDQRICTGTKDGIAMPLTSWQRGTINKHALEVRAKLNEEAKKDGLNINPGDWGKALTYVSEEMYRK